MRISLIALFLIGLTCAGLPLADATKPKPDSAAASPAGPKEFKTPKEAADSLVQAAAAFDVVMLKEILGPDSVDIISSQDPVADKERAVRFAAKAKEKMLLGADAKNANRAILTVGNDDFPMPIPIVRRAGKWHFDTKGGRNEILLSQDWD